MKAFADLAETELILAPTEDDKYFYWSLLGVHREVREGCALLTLMYRLPRHTQHTRYGQVPQTIRLRTRIRLKKQHQHINGLPLPFPIPFPFPLAFPFRFQAKRNPVRVGAGGECIVDVIGRRCEVFRMFREIRVG